MKIIQSQTGGDIDLFFSKNRKDTTFDKKWDNISQTIKKAEYDASYYQLNKEKKKQERRARYKAQKLGFFLNLVNGIFGRTKTTKTQKDYNRNYHLKKKREWNILNSFVSSLGKHTPPNQKEIYREKKNDTKPYLRESGTILSNICNILGEKELTERTEINRNKGGRPRCEEAQKLGRPLTNAERQKRKWHKKKLLQINQPKGGKKRILKMLDNSHVRIETIKKRPSKRGKAFKGWKIWVENKMIDRLKELHGEFGARVGKIVKYYGRDYYFNWFDNDAMKKSGIPTEKRKEIMEKSRAMCQKLGVAFVEGMGGLGMPILSKEPLTDLNVSYGDWKPAEFLIRDRQAQVEGKGKVWTWQRPLIVKNAWGLCQIFNRKETGWRVEERDRKKSNQGKSTNTNIYQPQELQENYNKLLSQYKVNETWQLQTTITNTERIKANWQGASVDPHIAYTNNFYFFFNSYQKGQAKLNELCGQTVKLELKRGRSQIFLNRIITQPWQTI